MHAKLSSINPMDFLDWEILRSTSIAGSLRHFGRSEVFFDAFWWLATPLSALRCLKNDLKKGPKASKADIRGRLWRRNPATLSLKERQAVYARPEGCFM